MSGFSSLTGGGGLSASSSARSGDSSSGSVGIQIQGITTGGSSNSGNTPTWVMYAALALLGLIAWKMVGRR